MSDGVLIAVIGILGGGGLGTIVTAILSHAGKKKETRQHDIDVQLKRWQDLYLEMKSMNADVKVQLAAYSKDVRLLERYTLELEKIIAKAMPDIELPPRPVLAHDNVQGG